MSNAADRGRRDEALRLARPHKFQSLLVQQAENLSAAKLQFASKHLILNAGEPDPRAWTDIDSPELCNWAFKLPIRPKVSVFIDIDIDIRPADGKWTPEREKRAGDMAHLFIMVMHQVAEIDTRYRFGRASFEGWGHVLLSVSIASPADLDLIRVMATKKPVLIGDMSVKFEVRLPANAKDRQRTFTAPGSIYPRYVEGAGLDPLIWQYALSDPEKGTPEWQRPLPAIPIPVLRRGLWAGFLTLVAEMLWVEGNRHEAALVLAGVMATEIHSVSADEEPLIDEAFAEKLLRHWCADFADPESKDRLQVLKDTLAGKAAGRPITGYGTLGEDTSPEIKAVLLRCRGGADPDAYADLIDRIVYARNTSDTAGPAYVDKSVVDAALACHKKEDLTQFYTNHPSFPHIQAKNGPIPLVKIVLGSKKLRQVEWARRIPGVDRHTYWVTENGQLRPATDEEIVVPGGAGLILNIAPGFATPCPEVPDTEALKRFRYLLYRQLKPLTRGNPVAIAKIEKMLAFIVRYPLEKVPFALVMSGGQGIGKSSLFTVILRAIFGGSLIGKTVAKDLEGQFYLADLEGAKIYVVDEVKFSTLDNQIRNMLIDLVKGETAWINKKYGAKREVQNLAVPIFLTNEANPGYIIKGQKDRAVAYVFGDSQESLQLSLDDWQQHINTIADQTHEFIGELRTSSKLREAAMYYFHNYIGEVTRADFEDNTDLPLVDVEDTRDSYDPIEQALFDMIEQNRIHPAWPHGITHPFRLELVQRGIAHHHGKHPSLYSTTQIGKAIEKLLAHKEPVLIRYLFPRKNSKKRERIRYINLKYGSIIERVRENTGIALEPAYELDPKEDFGQAGGPPTPEQCEEAFDCMVDSMSAGNSRY